MKPRQVLQRPVLQSTALHAAEGTPASEVWKLDTADGPLVMRTSTFRDVPQVDFWQGANRLFGVQPASLSDLRITFEKLAALVPGKVPAVLGTEQVEGREFLVLSCLPGQTCPPFEQASAQVMEQLGMLLACIHRQTFEGWGHPAQPVQPLDTFHPRLLETMHFLVDTFHPGGRFRAALEQAASVLSRWPVLEASLVMLDQDPTQYLVDQDRLTGLVDVEAYVVAPRALDLIGLEHVLDHASAAAFKRGYQTVLPLPDLRALRFPYRLFCRLMSIQGQVDLDRWMAHPALLD